MRVRQWRSSVRRVVPIAAAASAMVSVVVEMVAHPVLELGHQRVGGREVADRRLDADRRALVDEQEAGDGVGQLRAGARDEAHREVDVGERGAGRGDRAAVDDHARHVELDPRVAPPELAGQPPASSSPRGRRAGPASASTNVPVQAAASASWSPSGCQPAAQAADVRRRERLRQRRRRAPRRDRGRRARRARRGRRRRRRRDPSASVSPPPVVTCAALPTVGPRSGRSTRSTVARTRSAVRKTSSSAVRPESKHPGTATSPTRMSQTVSDASHLVCRRGSSVCAA